MVRLSVWGSGINAMRALVQTVCRTRSKTLEFRVRGFRTTGPSDRERNF